MEQLNLNYEPITDVAGRAFIRENFTASSKTAYWVRLGDISIREDYNDREVYGDMDEFAATLMPSVDIKKNRINLKTPMDLWVLKDGRNLVKRGHRRLKGMLMNVDKGIMNLDMEVEYFPVPASETEFESKADILHSNNSQDLTWYEKSKVVYQLKHNYSEQPKSHEEVAAVAGVARQTIDNWIAIHEEGNDLLRNQIKVEGMSLNKALELIRSQRKLKKQTDKAEENSLQTGMYISGTKDELAGELKELKELEETPIPEEETEEERSQRELREQTKREQAREQLLEVSDEINVSSGTLAEHIGKKLSADVLAGWSEDFVDEDTAEVVTIERQKVVVYKGNILTEEIAADIVAEKVDTIFVYKKGKEPIAESFITEPVAKKEKGQYESDRQEMLWVNNIITLGDKLEVMVNKLDVPEGFKNDIASVVLWIRKDAEPLRDWVFKNKKENKSR